MLIFTAKLSRRKLLLALGAVLLAAGAAVLALRGEPAPEAAVLETNEQRVTWLESYGWELKAEPVETLQLLLPDNLDETYAAYNRLQREQGMDLSACCGRQVTRYTYAVTNYPGHADGVQANLYLCGGTPVAGDILVAGKDGFRRGLTRPAG